MHCTSSSKVQVKLWIIVESEALERRKIVAHTKVLWNNQMWSYEGIKGEIRDMISFNKDLWRIFPPDLWLVATHSAGPQKGCRTSSEEERILECRTWKRAFCALSKKEGKRIHGLHFWPWFAFRDPDGPAYHPTYKWHHLSKHHILDHFELCRTNTNQARTHIPTHFEWQVTSSYISQWIWNLSCRRNSGSLQ